MKQLQVILILILILTANNKVTVSVILDELTGDIIEATGNGRLIINVPALGDVTMNGRYNIEQGNYNFNFQSLVKKPFELLPDQNSYIEWNGDPFNAYYKYYGTIYCKKCNAKRS